MLCFLLLTERSWILASICLASCHSGRRCNVNGEALCSWVLFCFCLGLHAWGKLGLFPGEIFEKAHTLHAVCMDTSLEHVQQLLVTVAQLQIILFLKAQDPARGNQTLMLICSSVNKVSNHFSILNRHTQQTHTPSCTNTPLSYHGDPVFPHFGFFVPWFLLFQP
jgi:hypothetical protein